MQQCNLEVAFNAFDSVVSLVAYVFLLKKEKINLLSE